MNVASRSFAFDFEQRVQRRSDAVAVVDARTNRQWSYGELDILTGRLLGLLSSSRVHPSRPVVSLLPNGVEQFFFFLAALRGQLDFAPLSPQMSGAETVRFAQMLEAGLCLVPEHLEPSVRAALERAGLRLLSIATDGRLDWLEETPPEPFSLPPRQAQSSRLYVATSGTTAEPKMVILRADTLWSSGCAFVQQHRFLDAQSRFYNVLPMSYLGGLFNLGLIPLATGGSVVIAESFSGASLLSFWSEVKRCSVNVLWLTPTMVRGLLAMKSRMRQEKAHLENSGLHASFLGMAPIDGKTKQQFEQEFGVPLLENYGISETTFLTTETLETRFRRREGSVGEILPFVEVRFAQGRTGEMQVRTPFLCEGYLEAGESKPLSLTPDGFFKTGDLGALGETGSLILRGRLKDIIKKGGYLICLQELEAVAQQHPGVAEAAAVGIPHDFYGEDAVVFVRWWPQAQTGQAAAQDPLADFRSWLIGRLPRFKWPCRVVAVDEFPRTMSGKVKKRLLAERLGAGEPSGRMLTV